MDWYVSLVDIHMCTYTRCIFIYAVRYMHNKRYMLDKWLETAWCFLNGSDDWCQAWIWLTSVQCLGDFSWVSGPFPYQGKEGSGVEGYRLRIRTPNIVGCLFLIMVEKCALGEGWIWSCQLKLWELVSSKNTRSSALYNGCVAARPGQSG